MTTSRTGGQILVDQLITHGVQQLFCVPGESFLAVLDALHDASIDVTVGRQEGGGGAKLDLAHPARLAPGEQRVQQAFGDSVPAASVGGADKHLA